MKEKLSPEEIAILIRGRKILKARGLAKDADVKWICEEAGISRKTGYQWAKKLEQTRDEILKGLICRRHSTVSRRSTMN